MVNFAPRKQIGYIRERLVFIRFHSDKHYPKRNDEAVLLLAYTKHIQTFQR